MKTAKLAIVFCLIMPLFYCAVSTDVKVEGRIHFEPTYRSLAQWEMPGWFNDAVLGIYMHWGVYSVPGFVFTDPEERVDSGLWYGAAMYDRGTSTACTRTI